MGKKVSVIMSAYNESRRELRSSINSILNQTYKNLELIIVNDNPGNCVIHQVLSGIHDDRLMVINNSTNIGLPMSLNKAIKHSTGDYIARMDADDISLPDRLEKQIKYLESNELDIIGSFIQLIDEKGNVTRETVRFPISDKKIRYYSKWGTCLAHPTWFAKRNVFELLGGYRRVDYCEDYDFLLRAIESHTFIIGNMPEIGLQYRVRNRGISVSNKTEQYVIRRYLAKNRKRIIQLSENEIMNYKTTVAFIREVDQYNQYIDIKRQFKETGNLWLLLRLVFNRYLYYLIVENYHTRKREK